MEIDTLKISAGLRVGFWDAREVHLGKKPFTPMGYYTGPDLGDHIPGTKLTQKLIEGDLEFRVGVLFRPDLGKYQKLETILILETYIPEMFDYDHWETA